MFNKTVLPSGIRILTETIPYSQVVSVGVWLDAGARDEHDLNSGAAHFVEHMLFKGTGKRSARDIARELDVLGGSANAFTTRENTCLHATVMDSNLEVLVELFIDLLTGSTFAEEEIERERQVILQEIHMVEDMPEDHVHDLFGALLWGDHPLGRPILGSREVVAAMNSARLREFVRQYYTTDRIIIAAAGNVGHDDFVSLWHDAFAGFSRRGDEAPVRTPPVPLPPDRGIYARPLEQAHIILGTYGLSAADADRYEYLLLNVLLGGNMSSRLFQEIREKRGLAYSVYSYTAAYGDAGYLGVYLGVEPVSVDESLELVRAEINNLQHQAVSESELAHARDYVKSGLFLSLENMETIMTRLAKNELYFGRYIPLEEVLAAIDGVTREDILQCGTRIFGSRELTAVGLGPLEKTGMPLKS